MGRSAPPPPHRGLNGEAADVLLVDFRKQFVISLRGSVVTRVRAKITPSQSKEQSPVQLNRNVLLRYHIMLIISSINRLVLNYYIKIILWKNRNHISLKNDVSPCRCH